MSKMIKNLYLKVAMRYSKNHFAGVEVHKNPFGNDVDFYNRKK